MAEEKNPLADLAAPPADKQLDAVFLRARSSAGGVRFLPSGIERSGAVGVFDLNRTLSPCDSPQKMWTRSARGGQWSAIRGRPATLALKKNAAAPGALQQTI